MAEYEAMITAAAAEVAAEQGSPVSETAQETAVALMETYAGDEMSPADAVAAAAKRRDPACRRPYRD